jgi:hypothetical protein
MGRFRELLRLSSGIGLVGIYAYDMRQVLKKYAKKSLYTFYGCC